MAKTKGPTFEIKSSPCKRKPTSKTNRSNVFKKATSNRKSPFIWHWEVLGEGNYLLLWGTKANGEHAYMHPLFKAIANEDERHHAAWHEQYDMKVPKVHLRRSHEDNWTRPAVPEHLQKPGKEDLPFPALLFRVPEEIAKQTKKINNFLVNCILPNAESIIAAGSKYQFAFIRNDDSDVTPVDDKFRPLDHAITDNCVQQILFFYEFEDVPEDKCLDASGAFVFPAEHSSKWFVDNKDGKANWYFSPNKHGRYSYVASQSGYNDDTTKKESSAENSDGEDE